MSRGIARLNDRTQGTCFCHTIPIAVGGTIVTASTDTFCNDRGVARDGDTVLADCGHTGTIVTHSADTFCNGRGVARLNDTTTGCYVATIVTASGDSNCNGSD